MKKILLFLAVLLIVIFTAQAWAEIKEVQVFGFTLGKAKREEVRSQFKAKGIIYMPLSGVFHDASEAFFDSYKGDNTGVTGLKELSFFYTKSGVLSQVTYNFGENKDNSLELADFGRVRDILKAKYGDPTHDGGMTGWPSLWWYLGDYSINLKTGNLNHDELFLNYNHKPSTDMMKKEIEKAMNEAAEKNEAQKKKEVEKQKDKF